MLIIHFKRERRSKKKNIVFSSLLAYFVLIRKNSNQIRIKNTKKINKWQQEMSINNDFLYIAVNSKYHMESSLTAFYFYSYLNVPS